MCVREERLFQGIMYGMLLCCDNSRTERMDPAQHQLHDSWSQDTVLAMQQRSATLLEALCYNVTQVLV